MAVFSYTAARREAEVAKDTAALEALEVPDILLTYERLARYDWQHLPHAGGYEDQPATLMYELECTEEALAIQARVETNQLAAARSAGAKPGQFSRSDDED